MAELKVTPGLGYTQDRVTRLIGWITIGAAGAITAQAATTSGGQACGITFSRNAAGDYRSTAFHRGYKRVIRAGADVTMPTLGTVPTLAAGNDAFVNGISAANYLGTANITSLGIATANSSTDALADPTSGVTITWELEVTDI